MKIQNSPLVSVVMPVFNGEDYIEEAIRSVYRQTYSNFEIIVVDDGSSDGSFKKIGKFKGVTYLKQNNLGPAVARNVGVGLARGEYLAFLDQDDIWLPTKIEEQVSYFNANPKLGILFCKQKIVIGSDQSKLPASILVREDLTGKASLSPSAMMIKKKIFEQLGAFNRNYPFYSEADLILRLKASHLSYQVLSQILLLKRFHKNNLSYRTEVTQRELLGILRDSINRNFKYASG